MMPKNYRRTKNELKPKSLKFNRKNYSLTLVYMSSITKYDQKYYYNKYCKYKKEYLKLKQQMIGGSNYFKKSFRDITSLDVFECNPKEEDVPSWMFAFAKPLQNIVPDLINNKIDLNEFHSYFYHNTALLTLIYNSQICEALLVIENRDKFIPPLDVNLSYDIYQRPPLCASIYKGYNRCQENKCIIEELTECAKIIDIDANELNMGLVINKLLECEEIDILKNYHDCFIDEDLNAIDLALLLFDIDTLTKMKTTHPKELDNFLTSNKKKYQKYYNDNAIENTYANVLNKYDINASELKLNYVHKLLENDAKELQENRKQIKAEILKI